MAKAVRSFAEKAMLIWCRKSARLTTAAVAQALKIEESKVIGWENGSGSPTFSQLTKLANLYKRPTSVFYLSDPPRDFTIMKDFRSIANAVVGEFSPRLSLAIREARERTAWISDYLKSNGEQPLDFVGIASLKSRTELVGRRMRRLLGMTMQEQHASLTFSDAFRLWRKKCEGVGVCVFSISRVETDEMRGFAILDKYAPAVAVNSRDSYSARIFTLLHELAHILIGKEGISDNDSEDVPRVGERRIEEFCNSVAAEAAVPASHLKQVFPKVKDRQLNGIAKLANFYKVSQLVIAKRLLDMNAIDSNLYRQVWAVSRARPQAEEKKRRIPQHIQTRSRVGPRFAATAISAFRSGNIGGADLSHMLKMRLGHLGRLEETIAKYDVEQEAAP